MTWRQKPTRAAVRSLKPGASRHAASPEPTNPEAQGLEPGARLQRDAYVTALAMLARRELSEQQVRQRLSRKGHAPEDVDDAVAKLKSERSLDDSRVAAAIARTETAIKRRGRLRVRQQIQQAGISGEVAKQALDAVFEDVDDEALLQAALGKRLRYGRPIEDDREFQRLYRYLATQGFESDRILRALNARRSRGTSTDDEPA
ncbi:MAG: regulatory protein RecX [Vicinamibacterales bacterium]